VKRVSLATLAALALIGAAACKDAVTSPQLGPDSNSRYDVSNPPPPPIETSADGSFTPDNPPLESIQQSSGFQPSFSKKLSGFQPSLKQPSGLRFSVQGSSLSRPAFTVSPGCTSFSIPATYFFNEQSNAGYVHFSSDANGVNSSSNGMVKFAHGDFSGEGTLTLQAEGCLLVIDLSSVNDNSSFFGGTFPGFNLFFDDALLFECGNTQDCDPIEGSADMFAGGGD
jgi:hypothetical protein